MIQRDIAVLGLEDSEKEVVSPEPTALPAIRHLLG